MQVSSAQLGSLARLAAGQLVSPSSADGAPSSSGAAEFNGAATSVADGTGRFGDLTLEEFRCASAGPHDHPAADPCASISSRDCSFFCNGPPPRVCSCSAQPHDTPDSTNLFCCNRPPSIMPRRILIDSMVEERGLHVIEMKACTAHESAVPMEGGQSGRLLRLCGMIL